MEGIPDPMVGPGGERPIRARWVVQGTLRLESPAHFGGEGDEVVDMPILRDRIESVPLLSGTSLAGALRSHLADRLAGYAAAEPVEVMKLFGVERREEAETPGKEGPQSALIVFDSLGALPSGQSVEIRDRVAIQPEAGTAEEHKKFELEILPVGTTFDLRLDLLVPAPRAGTGADPMAASQEKELLALLAAALHGLEDGQIPLGASGTRGFGRCRVTEWRGRRFDLTDHAGWVKWLISDHQEPIPHGTTAGSLLQAIQSAWTEGSEIQIPEDRRRRFQATLNLRWPKSGLLVRSPGTKPGDPDATHLHSGGVPVLPGTSLAGVLRTRAMQIAKLFAGENGDAWIDGLFGPRSEGIVDPDFTPRASRILASESRIEDGQPLQPTRIKIDRFTGGVVDGHLFDEEPVYNGHTKVTLEIRNPEPGEAGLLLLVIKDLLIGALPVGGSSSVGRGVIGGTATFALEDGKAVTWNPEEAAPSDVVKVLNDKVTEFHEEMKKRPKNGSKAAPERA